MSKRLCVLSDTELDYMEYVEDIVRKTTEFMALGRRQELLRDQIVQSNVGSERKSLFKKYEEVIYEANSHNVRGYIVLMPKDMSLHSFEQKECRNLLEEERDYLDEIENEVIRTEEYFVLESALLSLERQIVNEAEKSRLYSLLDDYEEESFKMFNLLGMQYVARRNELHR